MSHHARIEEVSDSEPDDMDPSDFDPQAFAQSMMGPGAQLPAQHAAASAAARNEAEQRERSKHWQVLYPVYFDGTRTRAEGRRVGKELAVPNPLAREMVDAVAALGLSVVFEPGKTHPKDWANPGRVRVLLKEEGKAMSSSVKNKHHLYNLVAAYLKAHPATEETPLRLRIAGLPPPKEMKPPAAPRGWKMNTILPLHSAALSGGGVSENMFKDMMAELQGEQGGSGAGPSGSGAGSEPKQKKKDKKKGKA